MHDLPTSINASDFVISQGFIFAKRTHGKFRENKTLVNISEFTVISTFRTDCDLQRRIELLSRSIMCAKSSTSRTSTAVEGEFLHELEEKMEVQ